MFEMNDIKTLNFDLNPGDRYVYEGVQVPRVTEIISKTIHENSLMNWSNSLGFRHKRYKDVLDEAAEFGSLVHHGIEVYLKSGEVGLEVPQESINAFMNWYNNLISCNKVDILGQEQKLICPYYGGTYDLLISINDKVWLVDFKTSNHVTYKYYLQLAAYNRILREQGINIDGCLILQLSKTSPSYNEYILDLSNPIHKNYFDICERTFMSMVYEYYHINYLEREFKNVNKNN